MKTKSFTRYLLAFVGLLLMGTNVTWAAQTTTPIESDYTFISETAMNGAAVNSKMDFDPYIKCYSTNDYAYATNKGKSVIDGVEYLNTMQIKEGRGLKFSVSAPCTVTVYGQVNGERFFKLGTADKLSDIATCGTEGGVYPVEITEEYVNTDIYLCASGDLYLGGLVFTFAADEEEPEINDGDATVKMTYVDFDNADTALGEVETAQAGYNKIANGEVGFVNTGWGCNWITYLQVDASEYPGTIISAKLTFDASGSTDSKRTTGWGVGYNSSVWSADMTYNTADKSITTMGTEKWTTTKSATVFESFEFDITEALQKAEGKVATILVYETAAAGGYLKNPVVTVSYSTATPYNVTFVETNGVEATIMVNGSDVTNGGSFINGTYEFTATAAGYKDYAGEFTVAGADKVVEFTMTEKAVYSYTVSAVDADNNDLGVVNEGTGYEGEEITYYYPEFVQNGTTLYKKTNNSSNPYWGATGLLNANKKDFLVTYGDGTIEDVVFYKEAEDIEGFTPKTTNNAPIRCSNGVGGIVEGEVALVTLPAGKYKIFGQVWGTTGLTAGVKANGEDVWTLASTGSLASGTSEEFELSESTELYVYTEGGNDNHMLDLIYIVKTGDVATGIENVKTQPENGEIYNLQGQKVNNAEKGIFIINGKKVVLK